MADAAATAAAAAAASLAAVESAEAAAAATSAAAASALLAAFEAASTDWRKYEGPVPEWYFTTCVFWPVIAMVWLLVPAAACYFIMSRGRVTPYLPPNYHGGGTQGGGNGDFDKRRHPEAPAIPRAVAQ